MRSVGQTIRVLGFVAAWIAAPGFPAIVCTLTLPIDAHAAVAVAVPSCHESKPSAAPAGEHSSPHRGCCADARTSCCLRALDVDGAVGGVLTLDAPPALAVVAGLPTPTSLAASVPVFVADARVHSPPGSLFQVLRL